MESIDQLQILLNISSPNLITIMHQNMHQTNFLDLRRIDSVK